MSKWIDERHEVIGWVLIVIGLVYAIACLIIAYTHGDGLGPLMSNWTALGFAMIGTYLVVGRKHFDGLSVGPVSINSNRDTVDVPYVGREEE